MSLKILGQHAARLKSMVKQHGGIGGAFRVFKRTDDLKDGKLVGTDQHGNKYYENTYYFKVSRQVFVKVYSGVFWTSFKIT